MILTFIIQAKHDGKRYGVQTIKDKLNNVAIKTEFVKLPGAGKGGDWVVRISGEPIEEDQECTISMVFYAGFDHNEAEWAPLDQADSEKVKVDGESSALGGFSIVGQCESCFFCFLLLIAYSS